MKLIKPSVEYIPQEESKIPYKHIELCARTCYKSEDKITVDSAKSFVEGLIMAGHLSMLEHGTVYLFYSACPYDHKDRNFVNKYKDNLYTKGGFIGTDDNEMAPDGRFYNIMGNEATGDMQYCFTTNMRVLVENNWLDDLQYTVTPFDDHWPKRYTMKFICDRGVSHELVRHRVFSFAQESQRYCNYSKDKFDKHVTFVRPTWCTDIGILPNGVAAVRELDKTNWEFIHALCDAENTYFDLLSDGWTPQQARSVLPNATKTEIIMTGFEDDWRHFLLLRSKGVTGRPHPDMKYIADKVLQIFVDLGVFKEEEFK